MKTLILGVLALLVMGILAYHGRLVVCYLRISNEIAAKINYFRDKKDISPLVLYLGSKFGLSVILGLGIVVIPPSFYEKCSPEVCVELITMLFSRLSRDSRCESARLASAQEIALNVRKISSWYRDGFLAALEEPANRLSDEVAELSVIRRWVSYPMA